MAIRGKHSHGRSSKRKKGSVDEVETVQSREDDREQRKGSSVSVAGDADVASLDALAADAKVADANASSDADADADVDADAGVIADEQQSVAIGSEEGFEPDAGVPDGDSSSDAARGASEDLGSASSESDEQADGASEDSAFAEPGGFNSSFEYTSKKKAAPEVHHKRSRRMRIALIVCIVLLCVLLAALCYFAFHLLGQSQSLAEQQTSSTQVNKDVEGLGTSGSATLDMGTGKKPQQKVAVPMLIDFIGLTQDDAMAKLGSSASVASSTPIEEEASDGGEKKVVGTNVTVSMDGGTTDAQGVRSSVYLTLDADGYITTAGYSTSLTNLGYGDVSFSSAVNGEHVIENCLAQVGIPCDLGTVALPDDSSEYRTYSSDGAKVSEEKYSFAGEASVSDVPYTWTARLSYDYSASNVSGNLSDTIKSVYVYVSKPAEADQPAS